MGVATFGAELTQCQVPLDLQAKALLFNTLAEKCQKALGLNPEDMVVTVEDIPRENWGINGKPGDEFAIDYKIDI